MVRGRETPSLTLVGVQEPPVGSLLQTRNTERLSIVIQDQALKIGLCFLGQGVPGRAVLGRMDPTLLRHGPFCARIGWADNSSPERRMCCDRGQALDGTWECSRRHLAMQQFLR